MIARLVSSVSVFAALVALALPSQAQGVAVGSSSLIGSLHYSDSFTIGAGATVPSRVTYAAQSFPLPSTVAWMENGHGNGVTSWGSSNFSIATDAALSATTDSPYPGSSGAGSATGFTQSGISSSASLDWSVPYGLSNDFVVQFDAVQMKGRVGVTIGPTGGNIEATGNISIFFRRNSSSLAQIGIYKNGIGETNTGLTSGISSAGQWHNYALRVNIPNQTIEVFVNQTSRGVINLATLGGGAYQLVSNTSVGFGGAGNDRIWTDNFQIGIPAAAPTVTGVTPASGPLTGGTSVTITGTKFTGATGVTFGGAAATGVTAINDTTITCTIPPGTLGPASVVVTTPNGTIAANTLFSYSNAAIGATSALIGTQHYSDSFTIGSGAPVTARITYTGTFPLSNAVATVENTYGNAAKSWGTSNFSIATDATVLATADSPYPGSSGAGSATGFTQSGISSSASLDWSIPYGLSNDFVVQFDAVQMKGRVGVSFGNSIGIAGTGNLSIFFRTAGSSSPQIGIFNSSLGELNTGLTSGIAVAGQWNNYAVRVNIPDKTVEVFVNQVSRGVINLATLNGGAYQNLMSNAFVGVGGSGNDRIWTDNFLVGTSNVSPLAPTVTTVAPASGPPAGGTSTTITGTNFTGTTAVSFGGIAAASFTVVNATTITAITAARTEGTVDVSVTNPFGTGIGRGLFTYGTPPTISHVLPPRGGTGGGTRVTLVGTGFTGATGVTLGGFPATSVNVINDNMLTAITGAGGSGLVNVVVSRPNGTGSGVGLYTYGLAAPVAGNAWLPRLSGQFNWLAAACSADGSIQFAGAENYNLWRSLDFGVTWGTPQTIKNWKALACSANGAKLIAAATAPGEILTSTDSGWTWTVRESSRNWVSVASSADGNKLAAVVNGGQIFTSTDSGLTWAAREGSRNWSSIASSADGSRLVASVAGGQIYTSTDSGVTWAARDSNRNWSAVASSASGDWLTATSRGEFGTGSVYFSSDAGVTWAGLVTFTTPISLAMSADGRRVVVGSANGKIHRTASLGAGGWISAGPTNTWNAVAMSADGGRMLAGGLASEIHTSYGALPLASSVSPTFGPTSGGTACQLFGENLSPGGPVSVTVGGVPATVTFTSPFFIGFTTNARTAGTVDIVVTTANGSVTRSAAFTYGEPPSISAVLPPNGSPAGGTNVTIVGANFTGVTSVTLGGTPLTSFTILSGSTLSFVTPPRTAGAVDVVVTNPFGTATRAGGFTYAPQAVPAGLSWTAQGPTLNWTSITSSADGTRLAAIGTDLFNISSSIYTSADSGVTWVARETQRAWREIASSADGSKLVATVAGGFIYTSGDFGVTWTARSTSRNWDQVTSSADGTRLAATGGGTSLAVSTDSGVTWALQATTGYSWNDITLTRDGNRLLGVASAGPLVSTNLGQSWSNLSPNLSLNGFNGITASADGTKLAATGIAGFIYTSTNSGTTWTQRESERSWRGITSSANGAVIAAVSYNGFIYVSTDAGVTWNQSASSRNWQAITSSADGSLLAAVAADSTIWISRGGFVPEISSITPSSGGTAGGTMVTISGAYLTGTTGESWTAPAGVTSVTVEVWGGGGRGGSITSGSSESAGAGGGGGGYSRSVITVVPGNSYSYFVGAGSTSTADGGDSYFIDAVTLMANGGTSAADNSTSANGVGGALGAGTTRYTGGNGADGTTSGNYGGGGGSSAGTGANGVTATNATGATAPTGGGNGGNGKSSPSGNGSAGVVPGGSGGGAYRSTGSTTYAGGAGANGQVKLTYFVDINATTTSVNCGAGTPSVDYGSSISCVATVTRAGGTATPTGTVSWTTNGAGSFVTSPCTLLGAGASASCSVTYTPSSVGAGLHSITANYSGDLTFLAGIGNQMVTVNKKAASVTPSAASKTYGDADPASFAGTLTGFLPADNVTATYSRVAGETVTGGPYAISGVLSPIGVLANYNITYNTADFIINKKAASVTPNAATKSLGAADPELTGSLTGFLPADNVTATYSRVAGETIENSPYTISAVLSPIGVLGNYNVTYNTANFTITAPLDDYTLTINKIGNGTVTVAPEQAVYHYGDVVTLTATPDEGWSFGSWSANVVAGQVTIHGNTTVTATFTQNEYTLTIVSVNGVVTPNKAAPYHLNDVVELTAVANAGWTFADWTGDLISTNNPDSVTIHGNTTVTANYTVAVNVAPSFTSTAVTGVAEDSTYTYNITATDPNIGDTLSITATTKPLWLSFTDNGNGSATLTGTPTNAEVGSHEVVLHVSDGTLTGDQTFSIAVTNTNDAPVFTSTPVTSAAEDTLYTYNITVSDPDLGASLIISAPVIPAWLTLTDKLDGTAVLTGTPGNGDVGINNVTLRVNDGTVDVDQVFTIDVGNTNDGPSFTSTAVTSVNEDAVYTYSITATDPDAGDTLAISATTLPAWLTLTPTGNGTATLSGTPTNSEVGDHAVALQVTDGIELASQTFTITVVNTNDAPVLAQPAEQNNAKGAVINLQLSATDVDAGYVLTYSATGLPDGLSIDPASGLITGTLTTTGTFNVTATVDDGNGGTDSKSFNWTVTESTYSLTINIVGNGTVTKAPDKTAYLNGEEVTLTATPAEGWIFGSWSENVVGGKVTVNGNTTVTVTFTQNVYVLTVNKVGNGTVTPDKAAPYHLNDVVILTAAAEAGWTFSGWSGDCSGTGTCSVTMDGDKTVTATFTINAQNGIYDDANGAWTYTGNWQTVTTIGGPYLDTWHYTNAIGDAAQIAFTGRQFKLTYLVGPDSGIVDVYVDNVKIGSIDQVSSAWSWHGSWTSGLLPAGDHTLRLVYASGGSMVSLDALQVMDTQVLPIGIYDDANAAISYTGAWQTLSGAGPYADTWRYAPGVGDSAQVAFSGQQIKLTYVKGPVLGIMEVYVDGIKVDSIDQNSASWAWHGTWASDLLPVGDHLLRLAYAGGGSMVSLDSFQVVPILSVGTYDDADTALSYIGTWQTLAATGGPYLDSWSYSNMIGDSVKAAFSGEQIKLTYITGPILGLVDVYVDNVKVGSINQNSTNWAWHGTWTSDPFTAGNHILRLVYASGGSMVSLDAISVVTPQTLSTGIYDDTNAAIGYNGVWQTVNATGGYQNTWTYSTNIGDAARIAFSGQEIKLTYVSGPILGTMDVYVDDVKIGSIDQNSIYWGWNTWVSELLPVGDHILRLVYASGGSIVSLDSFQVVPLLSDGVYDDADPAITYLGNWQVLVDPNTYQGAWRYSPSIGASAQIAFTGRQIKLTYLPGPILGIEDVYVDGIKVASIDQYSANWAYQATWTSEVLSAGSHSLQIVYASGGNMISLDAITVIP